LAIGGIAWASLTEIRELTSAPGQILPIGQINNVQHLEGGIVSEILVREGIMVREGDPIVRLSPLQASADSDQIKTRSASLKMTMARLEAQSMGRPLDISNFQREFPKLVEQQMALWNADEVARGKERETLQTRIRQRQQELITFEKEDAGVVEQLNIAKQQHAIQEELVGQGYSSKKMFLDSKSALQRSESDYIAFKGKIAAAKETLKEAESLYAELMASVARKIADERSKATAEYAEITGQVDRQFDRMDRLVVRATSTGIIQELLPKVTGEILRPSEVVAKILPLGQDLIAEVRIDPKDIGHVKIGDKAEVKFSTFDPALFGFVTGKVEKISGTTIMPAQVSNPVPGADGQMTNLPYYKAIVKLDKLTVGEGKFLKPITSGMVVTADIITGSKSLTRYMLKPVARSLDKAFAER
jgi:HlyD family secretion protein/adhesin transport system membrane fusion protein